MSKKRAFETGPLGQTIPKGDPHAVSVQMPTIRDVVGYEQGDETVHDALAGKGYPRFSYHAKVIDLMAKCRADHEVKRSRALLPLPSRVAAEKCVDFMVRDGGEGLREKCEIVETAEGIAFVTAPGIKQNTHLKKFWQHTGIIVSSRQAGDIVAGRPPQNPPSVRDDLKKLVGSVNGMAADDVYLHTCGMESIFSAYEAVHAVRPGRTVQLGFSYVDTQKIHEKFGDGNVLLPYNDPSDLEALRRELEKGDISAVFCELPSNPLLKTIDVDKLHDMLEEYGVPLVVDDTVGTPLNIDLRQKADITVTSLTKFFSGVGNVMGGSMILNEASPHYEALKKQVEATHTEHLYPDDAKVLLDNGQDFAVRMKEINANAETLAEHLAQHPLVEKVHYPKGDAAYEALMREGGGYGGLLSFTLKDPSRALGVFNELQDDKAGGRLVPEITSKAPDVFDNLDIARGPSLGTNYTLACPYTLLAHYDELAKVAKEGVPADLIRVSVGRENVNEIIRRFDNALKHAEPGFSNTPSQAPEPAETLTHG